MGYVPEWETPEDLENERQASIRFAAKFGTRMEKLGRKFFLDFAVYRNDRLWCFLEVKRRRHVFGTFRNIWLSQKKIVDAVGHAAGHSVPAIFMAVFNGHGGKDDRCCRLRTDFDTEIGGREDRNCVGLDVEEVAKIPLSAFKSLREV